MNIIQIVDSEGGALRPLASLLKQHFAYYKVSYFDAAEEVFAELQNGVCPSLLIVGLPAVNEQSVMLMIEARRFWTSLPILVSSAWSADARAPVFEEFKFVSLEKLETSPVAHAAGMLFGAERVIDPNEEEDEKLTLSDVLQLHAIQGSTGTLRFGGRSRARVSLVGGLPVTAKAGKRTGKKALTRLLRRSSLSRCIFDPEVPEDVEFEITFDEMLGLFTSSDEPIAEVDVGVEDVDDIDVKDLLEEGGLETLLTLDSRPTLERIEETMRLLMKGDSVGGNQDSAQLNTPVSVESGELASLVESYELAGDLDEDSSPSGKSGELDVSGGRSLPRQPGNALGKPSLKDLTPPPAPSEDMNKKATLFISHDLIAAAAGERDDDSEWSEFSEVSEVAEVSEVSEVSEAKASSEALGEEDEVGEVSSEEPAKKDAEEGGEEEAPEPPVLAEVAEDTQKELEEPAEQVGEPDDVEDADAEASDLVAEEAPASEASVDDDASEPVGDDEDEDDGAAPDALVEDKPEKTPQVSSLDGVSREFLDAIDEDDETLKFDVSGLVAQLRHKQNEETEEGPDEHETLEAPDEELDESVDESEKPEELEALEALEEELDDDDDDLLLPHFKVRTSARDSFAQEETVKKKALPQQLLALDGEEKEEQQEAETVDREDEDEDESSLARPENSVVVEPYQELDEDSIEPDEDLSEVSFAEEEEEGAEELSGEGGDDGDGDEQTFEIDPSESQSHAESEEESFYQDSEGTFELVDEVEESEEPEESEVDAGETHEGTFELVDEVDEADESADVEEDEVEDAAIVEAPEAHLDDGSQSEEEDSVAADASEPSEEHESVTTADVTELEREEEREREEEEEEIEHLGTQEFEELLTQEGTMEVDEDAILDSSTEEFESSTDDILEPPPTIPPEPPAEDDPWADLAEEVKEEEAAAEVTAAAPEQADAEPAPPEDIEGERSPEEGETQDRDLSRRLRAGAKDLLRHLRPPGSQAPTPEASSGSKKSPNEPEHFPREEAEEPVGLEQITRVAGTPSSDEGIADITSNPYISDGGLDDESSFSDIQIEELENVSVLDDDERGLDDQLSTVDRPLASDFVTREFERTPTSRVSEDKQELIETAEQPAVEKMAELSMSELDDEFGVGLDFLGDGLSETINDSLGFSSVTEEVSPDEIISIEEMETNELERAPATQEHPDDAEEELARASDEDLGPAEEPEEPEESKQPEGFEEPEEPDVVAEVVEVVEADEASSGSEDMSVKDEVPEDVSTAVRDALDTLAGVPGLVAVALVDTDADACFDLLRTGTIDVASSWPAEAMLTAAAASIRAQRDLLAGLGQLPNIEDVIFGVGSQHYILRPLDPESRWFLGLLGYTPRTNIALTRLLLGNACTSLGEILESIMNIPASASRKTPTRA